jgi:hypothetical protein
MVQATKQRLIVAFELNGIFMSAFWHWVVGSSMLPSKLATGNKNILCGIKVFHEF